MKKILVLGAGIYQVPLINKVKELGYYVIVVSYKGNYPGFKLADKIYYIDTTDVDEIKSIAKTEKIDAVITTGSDVSIITIGAINDELGLTGISRKSAILASDKLEMKKAFEIGNVRSAKYKKVHSIAEAYKVFNDLSKPVVFKAVDSSGSRGVIKVSELSEIDFAFKEVFDVTNKKYFIIEEFVEGWEFGAQAFVLDNEITFLLPHDDELFVDKSIVPIGHSAPIDISDNILNDIKEQVELSVKSLKLNNCALNIDFILKNDKVFILEIGARSGATCLPELVSITFSIDYYKYIIDVALGYKPTITFNESEGKATASLLLYSCKSGEIEAIENLNVLTDEEIVNISLDYKIGDMVNKFKVGSDRIGQIIVKADSLSKAEQKLRDIKSKINFSIS